MTSAFYSKAQGVVCCFEVGSVDSFRSIPSWIKDIRREAPQDCQIILCANKTDLPDSRWQVSREEYNLFAKDNGLLLFESSASSGQNVKEIFSRLASQVLLKQRPALVEMKESDRGESIVLFDLAEPKKTSSSCCS